MKKNIVNIMATTGVAIVILSIIAILYDGEFLFIRTVFEVLLANIIIHCGLKFTTRFESTYPILESLLDVIFIAVVLIILGKFFGWYSSIPIWILIIMAVLIYIIGCILGTLYVRNDIKTINGLIKTRKIK